MKRLQTTLLAMLLLLFSCGTAPKEEAPRPPLPSPSPVSPAEESRAPLSEEELRRAASEILGGMSLDEKIGQLFMLAMRHSAGGRPALVLDDYLKRYLSRYHPGGIILFSLNFSTPEQTRRLIADLQEASPYPLFIATDEEGGKVSRLGKDAAMEVVALPPAQQIGRSGRPELARQAAAVLARDLRDLGFNMDMAPVADVSRRGSHDVIGSRSFSSDPELTGEMVAAAVRGFEENRISSVLKHFPGHGYVDGDTHRGTVRAMGSRQEFENVDFLPFMKGIEAGSDFIMTAHIQAPSLTGNDTPASLSERVLGDILRRELGFRGIILTDAMDMGAISRYWDPGEAALKAFSAGVDIILMPANIPEAQDALKQAYLRGEISEERLRESLIRILSLKIRKGLFDPSRQITQRIDADSKKLSHDGLMNALKVTSN